MRHVDGYRRFDHEHIWAALDSNHTVAMITTVPGSNTDHTIGDEGRMISQYEYEKDLQEAREVGAMSERASILVFAHRCAAQDEAAAEAGLDPTINLAMANAVRRLIKCIERGDHE